MAAEPCSELRETLADILMDTVVIQVSFPSQLVGGVLGTSVKISAEKVWSVTLTFLHHCLERVRHLQYRILSMR